MPKFSFFHLCGYGRAARKNGDPKAHVAGIVAEAERRTHACRHVRSPMKPIRIYGCSPSEAAADAVRQADLARDVMERKIRRDGVVMFAAVASYPAPTPTVVARKDGGVRVIDQAFTAWVKAVLAWARKQFGPTLRSAVLHVDEDYPHIHLMIVPALVEARLRHDLIHPGRSAIAELRQKAATTLAAGVSDKDRKRAERLAYCEAMKALLDDYHGAVGQALGHERYGPRRRRRARAVQLEVRRAEQERDVSIARAKRHLQQRVIRLRQDDEQRILEREAQATETFLSAMRYRDGVAAELEAERRRGDEATAALARALAVLKAHGLSVSAAPRSGG